MKWRVFAVVQESIDLGVYEAERSSEAESMALGKHQVPGIVDVIIQQEKEPGAPLDPGRQNPIP